MKDVPLDDLTASASDASTKMCLDVIENNWSKETGGKPAQFDAAVRKQLHAEDLPKAEVDKLYMQAVTDREVKAVESRGPAKQDDPTAFQIIDAVKKLWHCE